VKSLIKLRVGRMAPTGATFEVVKFVGKDNFDYGKQGAKDSEGFPGEKSQTRRMMNTRRRCGCK